MRPRSKDQEENRPEGDEEHRGNGGVLGSHIDLDAVTVDVRLTADPTVIVRSILAARSNRSIRTSAERGLPASRASGRSAPCPAGPADDGP